MGNKTTTKNGSIGFDALNSIAGELPTQKMVPVTKSKRDNEAQFSLWYNKQAHEKLLEIAFKEKTTVKDLLLEGALIVIRQRDPEFTIKD